MTMEIWITLRTMVRVLFAASTLAAAAAHTPKAPPVVYDPTHMFAPSGLSGLPEKYDWAKLKRVRHERGVIFPGKPPTSGYNMHGYLAFFNGRYWAMWSCGKEFEDVSGQYVRYAISENGLEWSPSAILIPPDPTGEMRYFARGLWIRDGELLALASRDEAWSIVDGVRKKGRLFGPSLQLIAYRWNASTSAWEYKGVVLDDTINNYPPKQLPSGEWMTTRRDQNSKIFLAIGAVAGFDQWRIYPMPVAEDGLDIDEPHWWALPDGTIAAHFRPIAQSYHVYGNYRLYRAFSYDGGRTWTRPVRTNFPDARAKSNGLALSTGQYILAGNTRAGIDPRIPLTLATSRDGVVFTNLCILLDEDTSARYPNPTKHAGYQYPHVTEVNGSVFILYSKNQEDIEVLKIPLAEIERLDTKAP